MHYFISSLELIKQDFFSYNQKSCFWAKNSDIVERLLLIFSFPWNLNGIINVRTELRKEPENNLTI